MKNLLYLIGFIVAFNVSAQTVKDDLQLLLAVEQVEQVEIIEYIKTRIDSEFLRVTLQPRSNPKRLILEYIAEYLDASLVYDGNGWNRLIPKGYYLYDCDVYSFDYKLNFYLPAPNDEAAYLAAEKAFNVVYPETVIKVLIQAVNTQKIAP